MLDDLNVIGCLNRFQHQRSAARSAAGFTLLELMFSVAVAGILLAVAIPSFRTAIMNSRRGAAVNELVASLQGARVEAIKRGRQITICPTSDANATTPACTSTGSDWGAGGWLTYCPSCSLAAGSTASCSTRPDTSSGCGDVLMSATPNTYTGVTITANPVTITFQPLNRTSTIAAIRVCDSRGTSYARTISTDATGRPSLSTTATSCP